MKTNFQMLEEFKEYKPQSRMFTSDEEVKKITEHFALNERNGLDLQNLRDMVVMFYDVLMNREGANIHDLMQAMMSITAVIDNCKWNLGMEV